jgi:hypothetical protein
MFKLIAEQPIVLSLILGLIGGTLVYVWTRESNKWFAISGLMFLLLIPCAWLASGMIETEAERIELMVRDFASAVEANDYDRAYLAVHPSRPDILSRVKAELPRYEFTRARVGGINQIVLIPDSNPMQAVIDLMASVKVSTRGGSLRDISAARRLVLQLEQTDQGWKVIDYFHRPVIGPVDAYSTGGRKDWERYLNRSTN